MIQQLAKSALQAPLRIGIHLGEIEVQPLNSLSTVALAKIYSEIDSLDKFFEYANYEPPSAFAPWYRIMIKNPKVIRDPRFKELMDKMNLPMPKGYQ